MLKKVDTKGTILFAMYYEASGLRAPLKFAHQLAANGYKVIFTGLSAPGSEIGKFIIQNGFEYKAITIDKYPDETSAGKPANVKASQSKPSLLSKYRRKIRRESQVESRAKQQLVLKAEQLFADDPPDLVLMEQLNLPYAIPFLKLNVPIIGVNITMASTFSAKIPPVFSDIILKAKPGWLLQARILGAWYKIFLKAFLEKSLLFLRLRFAFGLSPSRAFNPKKLVKKYGGQIKKFEFGDKLDCPEMVFCPAQLDFPFIANSHRRHYIGTSVDTQRKDGSFNWDKIDPGKKLVYCTLGSYSRFSKIKDRVQFFYSVISAIEDRPDLQLIIQMPDEREIKEFMPFPRNVFAYTWVPHMEIFPRTSLIISHPGLGTIKEAIYFGIPMIAFSWTGDQPGNGARLVYHNLGLRGNIKKVTPKKITELIERVFNDQSIRDSVNQMQQVFREKEDCREGVQFIENFLARDK